MCLFRGTKGNGFVDKVEKCVQVIKFYKGNYIISRYTIRRWYTVRNRYNGLNVLLECLKVYFWVSFIQ